MDELRVERLEAVRVDAVDGSPPGENREDAPLLRAGDPRRFGWGDRMRETVEVIDRWPGRDHDDYRVRADDGAVYILRRDASTGRWLLVFFRADGS
jgi:hypothetical protein